MNFVPIGNMNVATGKFETIIINTNTDDVIQFIPVATTEEELLENALHFMALMLHLNPTKCTNPHFIENEKKIQFYYTGTREELTQQHLIQ